MKFRYLIFGLMFFVTVAEEKSPPIDLLTADKDWYIEDLKFPLGFAQEITLKGDVNLRFPPGWSKKESPNFWSYVWAWQLTEDSDGLNESELKENIELYFDGLLGINSNELNNNERLKKTTTATFILKKENASESRYIGEVKTIDTRYTKKPMTLFVQLEQYYCKKENKSVLLFRYSPKTYEHSVWKTLSSVKLVSFRC